jgi:hypothetical protein
MLGYYLRDPGSMNPLAMGEPILGVFWEACGRPAVSPKDQGSEPLRLIRVVEMKSATCTPNLFSWLAKRAG